MSHYFKKHARRKHIVQPDGTTLITEPQAAPMRFFVTRIHGDQCEQFETASADGCAPGGGDDLTWICINGMRDNGQIARIEDLYGLHHLTSEDILNTDHITKLDVLENYTFIVMKSTTRPAGGDPQSRQLSFVAGRNFLVSFLEGDEDLFLPLRARIKLEHAAFLKMGPGYLAYCLMDMAVDRYFEVLEFIDDEIYHLEEETTTFSTNENLSRIQVLRRKVIMVRRAAWPLREVINNLHRRENFIRGEHTDIYFNDIYDHVVQVVDTTETFREVLSNIFDIYLTSSGNRINEVVKVLTIITTVVMPMTVVTGLYGMNFKHMPELSWIYGYPMSIGIMLLIGLGMLWFFKKRDWL